ncbi:MAG: glycosyltransferase [Weeksellaceae bacterium]
MNQTTGKKEILVAIEEMNLGGTEKSFLTFFEILNKNGNYKIKLFLLKRGGALFEKAQDKGEIIVLEELEKKNRNIEQLSIKGILSLIKTARLSAAIEALYYFLRIKITGKWFLCYEYAYGKLSPVDADIAIAFSGPSYLVSWITLNKVNSKKKIQWIRFDVNKYLKDPLFGKTFYPKFDNIYCVSKSAFDSFVGIYPETKSNTSVFENVISKDYILEQSNEKKSFTDDFNGFKIITVGRLSGEKGQQMIPGIVERLKNDGFDFRWYLIGDGYLREELENEIINLNIKNHLKLLGNQINPYPFYKDCDLYVQTSFHEGYCQTVHEAKIFNKPVVTTDFINAHNLVVDNEDGLIVSADPESIYLGVRDLIENEQKRKKFSRFLKENEMQKPEAINDLVNNWFDE